MNVKEAAALYISRGWQVVPLSPRKKDCYLPDWQATVFTPEDFGPEDNIGIKQRDGLVDVDLDCDETVVLADQFLPETGAVYGRKSKPRSHRLYKSKIEQLLAIVDIGSKLKSTLIEIRISHQSMSPFSIHPCGETVEWESEGDPAEVDPKGLTRAVRLLATASLIARYYAPKGMRHLWNLPLTGVLRNLALTEDEATKCIRAGANLAQDDEIEDRIHIVRATYARSEEDALAGEKLLGDLVDTGKQLVFSLKRIWIGKEGRDPRGFVTTNKGVVLPNSLHNILLAFKKMNIESYEDVFNHKIIVNDQPFTDAILDRILVDFEARFNLTSSETKVQRVLEDLARQTPRHPVKEYLANLEWDKKKRIDTWLISYGGADNTDFVRAIGSIVLIAAVRRVRVPGCKFDEMLILESDQGWNKSTALRALCPREDWFTEGVSLGLSAKETIEQTGGCWIIEASELKGLRGRGQDRLKTFLSRQKDGPVRLAYEKLPVEVYRQFVVIGTTNAKSGYLQDITGNRRYWPVLVKVFDVERIRKDRDQLWAEAASREMNKESIRLNKSLYEKAEMEQEARRGEDPWEGLLEEKYKGRNEVAYMEVFDLLSIPNERLTRDIQIRLHNVMQKLGFEKNRVMKREGKSVKGWRKIGYTPLFGGKK